MAQLNQNTQQSAALAEASAATAQSLKEQTTRLTAVVITLRPGTAKWV